jgi:hypothetical protein
VRLRPRPSCWPQQCLATVPRGRGHPFWHPVPGGQHRRSRPEPHGVVPGAHPQMFRELSAHATPRSQHTRPQGVVPLGQQQPGLAHTEPRSQHRAPHTDSPALHTWASARSVCTTAAAALATAAPASTRRARRRGIGLASVRLTSSNRSLTTGGLLLRDQRCNPHSVLSEPAQRPERGSSPSATGWVHGWQPMDG